MSQLTLIFWLFSMLVLFVTMPPSGSTMGLLEWTPLVPIFLYPLTLLLSWRREAFLRRAGEKCGANLLAALPLLWVALVTTLIYGLLDGGR